MSQIQSHYLDASLFGYTIVRPVHRPVYTSCPVDYLSRFICLPLFWLLLVALQISQHGMFLLIVRSTCPLSHRSLASTPSSSPHSFLVFLLFVKSFFTFVTPDTCSFSYTMVDCHLREMRETTWSWAISGAKVLTKIEAQGVCL